MATSSPDPGFGFLYPKKDRKGNQPNLTGVVTTPSGEVFEVASWTKVSKAGVKYLNLKLQELSTGDEPAPAETAIDDDIPF